MGINFADLINLPWVNLWNQLSPDHSNWANGCEIGADGWPTAGRDHKFVIGEDRSIVIAIPAGSIIKVGFKGTYDQFFENEANCSIVAGSEKNDFPKPGYAYLEVKLNLAFVPIEQFVSGTNVKAAAFNFHGHVEDVRFMRPGFEIDDNTIVHPDYTKLLTPFSTFRFMGYMSTNSYGVNIEYDCSGPDTVGWSYRWPKNAPQSFGAYYKRGAAWEYAIDLCNEFDKDMWINIPLIASDDYITQLSKLIKSNLKPKLNVYVEIGNEIWNSSGGFCCYRQAFRILNEIASRPANINDPDQDILYRLNKATNTWVREALVDAGVPSVGRWTAKRLKHVVEVFAAPMGMDQINNRIRGVFCGQIGYGVAYSNLGWNIQNGLEYINDRFGVKANKYFYAIGAAPYFGPGTGGDFSSENTILNLCQTDIDENIFGEYSNELWNGIKTGNKFDGWAKLAWDNGLKLYSYEGGPDMDYTTKTSAPKRDAMMDPRMKDICIDYWTHWYNRFGYNSIFMFFMAAIDQSGLYTLAETFNQTSTRQEAINYMLTNAAPPFDPSRNIVDPVAGIQIDCRKVVAYRADWSTRDPFARY